MARPRIGQGVVVDVPATTANLGPGFDCLGAALDLNNRFEMRCIEGGGERFELVIEGSEGSHLRGGPDNLVYRAAQRVWKEAGEEPIAIEARVRLAVPPARGLKQRHSHRGRLDGSERPDWREAEPREVAGAGDRH